MEDLSPSGVTRGLIQGGREEQAWLMGPLTVTHTQARCQEFVRGEGASSEGLGAPSPADGGQWEPGAPPPAAGGKGVPPSGARRFLRFFNKNNAFLAYLGLISALKHTLTRAGGAG